MRTTPDVLLFMLFEVGGELVESAAWACSRAVAVPDAREAPQRTSSAKYELCSARSASMTGPAIGPWAVT